jgi:hypothetical protein
MGGFGGGFNPYQQMQSPYGPQQGGFGGVYGGPQMQSPYGPQMGGRGMGRGFGGGMDRDVGNQSMDGYGARQDQHFGEQDLMQQQMQNIQQQNPLVQQLLKMQQSFGGNEPSPEQRQQFLSLESQVSQQLRDNPELQALQQRAQQMQMRQNSGYNPRGYNAMQQRS